MAQSQRPAGYRGAAKTLHWLTVLALLAQFTVGYLVGVVDDSDPLLTVHLLLGSLILALAVVRVAWRRYAGLPPWAETLSPGERRLAHWTERALLTLLFVIPITGAVGFLVDDDLVAVHIAAHLAFFVVLAAHVGLVLKHQLVDRDRLLARML